MNNFITTNIRLPEEDYLSLKEEAVKKGTSLAAVIREKVAKKKVSREGRIKMLLNLRTDWFTDKDHQEYKKIRKDMEKKLKKYNW